MSAAERAPAAQRAAIAAASLCVGAALAYALVRGVEIALFPQPNPATVLWSERSGFVWRAAIALYAGGAAAIGGWAAASRDVAATSRALAWIAPAVALAAALQGMLAP